jgi:RNA polymerase sigma-70 factor (ECF subfamily)
MRLTRRTSSDGPNDRSSAVVLSAPPPSALGAAEQFRDFYERMHPRGRDFAERFTSRMAAEDAVQDALADVWLDWMRRGPRAVTDRYFLAIVRHKVFRQRRRDRRMVSLEDAELALDTLAYRANPIDARADTPADVLDLAIAALPPKRREVFVLAHEQEYTYKEVVTMLRVSEGTVRTHLRLATADVREAFATAGYVTASPRRARLRAPDPTDAQTDSPPDAKTDAGGPNND